MSRRQTASYRFLRRHIRRCIRPYSSRAFISNAALFYADCNRVVMPLPSHLCLELRFVHRCLINWVNNRLNIAHAIILFRCGHLSMQRQQACADNLLRNILFQRLCFVLLRNVFRFTACAGLNLAMDSLLRRCNFFASAATKYWLQQTPATFSGRRAAVLRPSRHASRHA